MNPRTREPSGRGVTGATVGSDSVDGTDTANSSQNAEPQFLAAD
jgi:hypothetical protein